MKHVLSIEIKIQKKKIYKHIKKNRISLFPPSLPLPIPSPLLFPTLMMNNDDQKLWMPSIHEGH